MGRCNIHPLCITPLCDGAGPVGDSEETLTSNICVCLVSSLNQGLEFLSCVGFDCDTTIQAQDSSSAHGSGEGVVVLEGLCLCKLDCHCRMRCSAEAPSMSTPLQSHLTSVWELFCPSHSMGARVFRAAGLKWQLQTNEAARALMRVEQE